jgi:CheY-like chemotaxis protein
VTAPTVLLVDDEPGVLFTLREVLHERGLGVVTAASGAAALPLLDDVAVVVTDLQMPGMTGLELMRRGDRPRSDHPGDPPHRLRQRTRSRWPRSRPALTTT